VGSLEEFIFFSVFHLVHFDYHHLGIHILVSCLVVLSLGVLCLSGYPLSIRVFVSVLVPAVKRIYRAGTGSVWYVFCFGLLFGFFVVQILPNFDPFLLVLNKNGGGR
jgi:hypothetical protein